MTSEKKVDRLLELLEEIDELYPGLDKMIINDPINPDYIIMASTEYLNEMADAFGISEEFEDLASEYPDLPTNSKKKKIQ